MTQIKLRRDTSANFTSKNPILGIGEPAYETDTKKLKIGDGTTAYTQLEYFSAGGDGSGLEICDIGMALYVDETKGLRRYLNGQIVDINTNTQAFLNRLKQITTLHPSLLCTEEEWQTAKTMSALGQVGKFVFNYSGADIVSVRLPRVINVQGLFDLQNLGMTVSAGLPTHTHTRGTMEISGAFQVGGDAGTRPQSGSSWANGAFNITGTSGNTNTFENTGGRQTVVNSYDFHASRSWTGSTSAPDNSVYGKSNTVQQEAIQYPYFIQIATGSETENNIINDIKLNNPYSLFDSKYSDHELNNLSWLKSSGQWNAKAVYPTAYDELLTEYNNSASTTETEGSITFKRTPKGYKIALADQETAIDTKYSTDGIAWYYILDTTNEKFKLPRTKFGFEGLRTNVGDDIKAGLPNITGSLNNVLYKGDESTIATGSFGYQRTSVIGVFNSGRNIGKSSIDIDASRSSSIYGNSNTVQSPATQMYLYFYVGETVQNANLIDAGRIGEQVANCITRSDCKAYVTETYKNGTSWYRVWSDGWCEQGGYNSNASATINLLKQYTDTNYIVITTILTESPSVSYYATKVSNKTTSDFIMTGNSTGSMWQTSGYIR